MPIGEIIKILPYKKSRNEGIYLRVEFKMEGGGWSKTDLVPGFRNYNLWKNIAKVGNKLGNLKMKDSQTVDADSHPILLTGRRKNVLYQDEMAELEKLAKIGVFG